MNIKLTALVLTIMGCVFASGVLTGHSELSLIGIGIGLCSGFGYALYSVFCRAALNRGVFLFYYHILHYAAGGNKPVHSLKSRARFFLYA